VYEETNQKIFHQINKNQFDSFNFYYSIHFMLSLTNSVLLFIINFTKDVYINIMLQKIHSEVLAIHTMNLLGKNEEFPFYFPLFSAVVKDI
jgi:hypothetical protein